MSEHAPHTRSIDEPFRIQDARFDWEHEVRVALPASYHHTDTSYPTLWVVDGSVLFELAVAIAQPDLIVVAVGCPRETTALEFARRRSYEFAVAEPTGWKGP